MCIFQQSAPNSTLHNCFCQGEDLRAVRCQVCSFQIFMCSLKNVLWRLSWAVVCWSRSLLTCYNVLFLRDWGNVMLFALPSGPAGFNHCSGGELDRRRGDPSSGQVSANYFPKTYRALPLCRMYYIFGIDIYMPELWFNDWFLLE